MNILVVEDESAIADLIELYLSREGFSVTVVADGQAGLEQARSGNFDLLILDVGLPHVDGTEICRFLRAEDNWTPIIFCTARDDEVDRVYGLELGADDYITKPFSPRELVARVKSIVRRSKQHENSARIVDVGPVRIDTASRRCWNGGVPVQLTAMEFDVLAYLFTQPGTVVSREELLGHVWGYSESLGTRTVDVHIAQLRAKLGENAPIRTVRGVGYAAEPIGLEPA
ncbi:MAG: response regulator transcription factor [Candidatus Nanopelagicales bacterium]|nr:response regulator transcription factor [Candidatus Nanopelagicales bacterium]MCF8550484.1 response regulator transcription factor [Candidatus Nanopelagicales bacterium]